MNDLVVFDQEKDQAVVRSIDVANNFNKRHDNVLKDIETLVEKDLLKFQEMFYKDSYTDFYGREQKCYLMNRDGFSLLVMGFTGNKALEWKLKYIQGFNNLEKALNSPARIMARALQMAHRELEGLQAYKAIANQRLNELEPKADYYDAILNSDGLLTITEIAKDYGMSGKTMNKKLMALKVQYKSHGTWLLYQEYAKRGYTKSKTQEFRRSDGRTDSRLHTYWTQKGRLFLYELLKKNGIVPLSEEGGLIKQ